MSSDIAIKVSGLHKSYKIFSSPGRRFLQPFMKHRKLYTVSEVLKDINLEIYRGETVGIVGANGAGKSTLLSIIAGVIGFDQGQVDVSGRVSALLSLGTGFVPELTGLENVFLNAMMLGLNRAETEEQLESILDFAAIGDYVDQPIRTYSSGMYARLAFSVAIHTNPEILIIDETLSVGDEAFQRKCFARIDSMKSNGVTILFVSHSAGAVLELCDRAIMLSNGRCLLSSTPKTVIGFYQKLIYSAGDKRAKVLADIEAVDEGQSVLEADKSSLNSLVSKTILKERYDENLKSESRLEYEPRGAVINSPIFTNENGKRLNILNSNGEYFFEYEVTFNEKVTGTRFSMLIKTINGLELGALWTSPRGEGLSVEPGQTIRVKFPIKVPFREGFYFANAGTTGFVNGEYITLHRIVDACAFKILPQNFGIGDRYVNICTSREPSTTRLDR